MKPRWLLNKKIIVILHVLFWLLLFSLPYLLRNAAPSHHHQPDFSAERMDVLYIIKSITWAGLFYLNAFFIIPYITDKKNYSRFFIFQLLIILFVFFIDFIVLDRLSVSLFIFFNMFPYAFILACSFAYRMFIDRAKVEREAKEKETEHLKTELLFLRSQISPHFIFNVLNNMVALARKKSDVLEPSLIKLSSILRYMLYENDEEKVSLQKEVEYLQSYIDLQQQRFGKNVAVKTFLGSIDSNHHIEPMLLIPFVENAFKHGTGLIENAQIDIELNTKNDLLEFTVRNKYNDITEEVKDKTSGIGLNNVKRRLNLLYKNRHWLQIGKQNGWFTVSLKLKLH